MNITERPIWDEERGLMTIEEAYAHKREVEAAEREAEEAENTRLRLAGNLFSYNEVDEAGIDEQSADGLASWTGSRIRRALFRSCAEYWPKEWKRENLYRYYLGTNLEMPPAIRHGRTLPEVLRLLVVYSLRTRNTKAAVRNFLLKPRAFLEREERHLVRKRLAK